MGKIVKVIKGIMSCICILIILFLVFILITERDPGVMAKLVWDQHAIEVYEANNGDFAVNSFAGFDDRTYSKDGRFGISRVVQYVDSDQWQMLVRYNDSVIENLEKEGRTIDCKPEERFVFTLSDDVGNIYTDYEYITQKSLRHSFVKLIFSDVKMSYSTENGVSRIGELKLNIYCCEDVKNGEYPEKPEATMYAYSYGIAVNKYKKLTKELPKEMLPTPNIKVYSVKETED